jgi:hypothetical protein
VAGGVVIELILDASGSMLQYMGGQQRIEVARNVLIDLVDNVLQPGTPVALRVFGHIQPDACRTDLLLPLEPLDPTGVMQQIGSIEAKNLARTPIADSLRLVADDLAGASGQMVVVLVTDGEETCDGDPAAAIQFLQDQGIDVRVNIVGFAIDDVALQSQFEAWAELGRGSYFSASSAQELGAALRSALRAPFRLLDESGDVVASGIVGDSGVEAAAGVYTLEVMTDPIQRVDQVIILAQESTVVQTR